MKRTLTFFFFLFATSFLAFAQGTQTWQQSRFDDFEKGTAKGIAITSDGILQLAPQFKPLYTSASTYIWAIASDRAGNVYAAAGSPARVYRVTPAGVAETIFQPQELQVQALLERNGVIYAATAPDGKVYRITEQQNTASANSGSEQNRWSSSVYFDPHTKYIWALAMDDQGRLYVATGDQGQIFRVTEAGAGSVFFQSADAHIRSLAFDNKGNLIAGSDGSGLIYRISTAGAAYVLYSAPKKEITALTVDDQGNIYAAGLGQKEVSPAAVPLMVPAPAPAAGGGAQQNLAAPPVTAFNPNVGGSDVYRIAPDDSPSLLWSSRDEIVYALAARRMQGEPQLLAATGNKGRIFSLRSNGDFTELLQASANQVTGFATAPAGGLYISTANLGKIFVMSAAPEREGTFESSVFDAHLFSRWGKLRARGAGAYQLETRAGNVENPDSNWSPWSKIATSGAQANTVQSPAARFFQWRATLRESGNAPHLSDVTVDYLTKNVAPVVDEITVEDPGAQNEAAAAAQPSPSSAENAAPSAPTTTPSSASPSAQPHTITIRWSAHDDNGDQLSYRLYYRGDGESNWLPLTARAISEKSYSFDSSLLPDGGYRVRVVASDAPSHSPQNALTSERTSERFEVDTTPPQVLDLHVTAEAESLHVTFRALDDFSPIRRAQYSLDARDWQYIAPVGEISDSKEEHYDFNIPLPAISAALPGINNPAEHVIAVRAYDEFGNVGSAKIVSK